MPQSHECSGPNVSVSLRDHMDEKFADLEKHLETSRQSMEKRLEGMNEFRAQLADQVSKFVTRDVLDAKLEVIRVSMADIRAVLSTSAGKAIGLNAGWVYLTGGVIAVAALVGLVVVVMNAIRTFPKG